MHVRSGPGTQYQSLWEAEMNYPVQVLEKKDKWIRFRDFEGYEGWISRPLLAKIDTVVVKRSQVNIRSGPGTNHEVAFLVEKGVPFRVLSRKGDWIQVQHADGDKGWIKKDLVW
ncbi:SH3 domain-containing protein [Desulfococcaceae bacterium OttesenSCG-928-F15]|nr:SH3 domain-containing protein [Desulfococcaceae bacterium OttesenSCG-928-F15]